MYIQVDPIRENARVPWTIQEHYLKKESAEGI
jgi:hypothetical protein